MVQTPCSHSEQDSLGWYIGKFGTNGFHTEMDLKTGSWYWYSKGNKRVA